MSDRTAVTRPLASTERGTEPPMESYSRPQPAPVGSDAPGDGSREAPGSPRRGARIDRALAGAPSWLAAAASRKRLCVLAYHGVDDVPAFRAQLDWLESHRTLVSLEDVFAAGRRESALPARATLLTFDDGDRSIVDVGLPILNERRIPATAFVIPGLIGTDQPFWWTEATELVVNGGRAEGVAPGDPVAAVRVLKLQSETKRRAMMDQLRESASSPCRRTPQLDADDLRRLDAGGVRVENHTWSHPCLDRCSDEVVYAEIAQAHEALTAVLGRAPMAFAYPNGNWDPRAEEELMRRGYAAGFLFDHRLAASPVAHPLRISRVRVDSTTTPERLAMVSSGLHPALHRLRGRT